MQLRVLRVPISRDVLRGQRPFSCRKTCDRGNSQSKQTILINWRSSTNRSFSALYLDVIFRTTKLLSVLWIQRVFGYTYLKFSSCDCAIWLLCSYSYNIICDESLLFQTSVKQQGVVSLCLDMEYLRSTTHSIA